MNSPPSSSFTRPMRGHPNGVQLGGIGTGRIELGRNGRITLAGFTHNPQRLLAGIEGAFFALQTPGSFHLLQEEGLDGYPGCEVAYQGLHPLAQVHYSVPKAPWTVSLRAFSPLIPHALDDSMFPGVHFAFRVRNAGSAPLPFRLAFSWEHLLGCGGGGARGLSLRCDRDGNHIEPWACPAASGLHFVGRGEEMILATPVSDSVWALQHWNVLLDRPDVLRALAEGALPARFDGGDIPSRLDAACRRRESPPSWDDPDPRFGGGRSGIEGSVHPAGVLGVQGLVLPGQAVEIPFALTWYCPRFSCGGVDHGNGYNTRFDSAASAARELLQRAAELESATRSLHDLFAESSLPRWLSDKILNDQTAITTNSIVTASGDLYTLEASPMMFGALGTLDQRLVSHPGSSWFFPDLNRGELRTFAALQAPDGSLPHFNGNAHTALASADVEYGRTGWPDLACSFIIQVYRDWVDTGESGFLLEMLPAIRSAAAWLLDADRDGDGVPEGGSSWDIEHYPGCFIATATVWLATLRVLEDLETRLGGDPTPFPAVFARASATVESMWTGRCYLKCLDPVSGHKCDDIFVGQLAGEWVVRQLALPSVLPADRVVTALQTIYACNGAFPLMPIQVDSQGRIPDRKYAWHAWPQYSLVFADCLALYAGLTENALANIAAFHRVVCEVNRSPWATTLWHDARSGHPDFESFIGLDWYMNTPASWWILPALGGVAWDVPAETLTLSPGSRNLPDKIPLITPRCHALLEYRSGEVLLHVIRLYRGPELRISRLRLRNPDATFSDIPLSRPLDLRAGSVYSLLPKPPNTPC